MGHELMLRGCAPLGLGLDFVICCLVMCTCLNEEEQGTEQGYRKPESRAGLVWSGLVGPTTNKQKPTSPQELQPPAGRVALND